jgi:hypothetical protein
MKTDEKKKGAAGGLWLFVGAAFLVLIGAWIALIAIATKNKVEEVPVLRTPGE